MDVSRRTLAFGAVPRGQAASRTVAIVNRGRAPVVLSLAQAAVMLASRGIEVVPAAQLVLKPRQEAAYNFMFR